MRPFKPADAIRAVEVTSRFPLTHGAPVHFGDPAAIGIDDIMKPEYGDPPVIEEGEVPVFWACGSPRKSWSQTRSPTSALRILLRIC